ncbi:Spc7 kinetochore protein-domain-containing protein [Parasitella parasitica]|nr:Spc7 kinetochore protein-domain-containing protein [Parasitella parasitica]
MRNIPNIIEETEPTMLMTDVFASPAYEPREPSPFLQRLTGSPSDRRKRRPDLFGSPPGNARSPKKRSGGQPPSLLNRVFDEKEEDEGTSDLTQYLSSRHQKGPRNIFEEDEDDDDEGEETGKEVAKEADKEADNEAGIEADNKEQQKALQDPNTEQYDTEEEELEDPTVESMMITQTYSKPIQSSDPETQQSKEQQEEDHRSFYLHEKSPLRNQRFSLSVESTDRIFSFHNADNDLLEEEFPDTYHSIPDIAINTNMPLSDFLSFVGISFLPEIPAKELRRRSTYNIDYGAATVAEQAAAAASTLPQLEVYQSSCQKLNELIRDCKNTIASIDEDVSAANPQFFSEYQESSLAVRSKMAARFAAIKNYAHSKAASDFYKKWCGILLDFTNLLKENHGKLLQDDQVSAELEQHLLDKLPELYAYQKLLMKAHKDARIKETEYNLIDHKALSNLEEEISQQENSIQGFANQVKRLEIEEITLLEKTATLERRKSELMATIKQAKTVLKTTRYVTEKDLARAADTFKRCADINKFRLKKALGDTIELSINGDVDVFIDQNKLRSQSEDAVLIRMLESRDNELGPLSELVYGLQLVAKDKWDMNEIIQDISIYWNRVRMVQHELEEVQRRFWVEIKSLEFANEAEDAGFSCQICVYSFTSKTKFTVSFQIKPKDILDYPSIDLSTFEVDLHYGSISPHLLEDMLQKAISESGFTNLVNTLRNILDEISIPS